MPLLHFPGGDLISQGLSDFADHRLTPEACLIAIGRSRLTRSGLRIDTTFHIPNAEHQLYALLGTQPGDAYSRYNALLRRLISFEQAIEQQYSPNSN